MHDNLIMSYCVDIKNKTIKISTFNKTKDKEEIFYAEGVLTHSFENILDSNIILSIDELSLDVFFKEQEEELDKKNLCWPIDYNNLSELKSFLTNSGFKYITISSSYGMYGWILAKEVFIDEQ